MGYADNLGDSKYRRWPPMMDNHLVRLLSTIHHSFPKGAQLAMTKDGWMFLCKQMRAQNPSTVYSTYTKYLCSQHLHNVIHMRYKLWYKLMSHPQTKCEFRYHWNPVRGIFDVEEVRTGMLVATNRVRELLADNMLLVPSMDEFNARMNTVLYDLFLTNHLRYMLVYHNEVVEFLIRTDFKFNDGFSGVPKFEYEEAEEPYGQPLPKVTKRAQYLAPTEVKRPRLAPEVSPDEVEFYEYEEYPMEPPPMASIAQITEPLDEQLFALAARAAAELPVVVEDPSQPPIFVKDRHWFNRLVTLHSLGYITAKEFHLVCVGVRDGKIPLFMLNMLDRNYHRDVPPAPDVTDAQLAQQIRLLMIPMLNL